MKSLHKTLLLSLVIASSLPNWADETQNRLSLRHVKAVRPDTTLNLLDSIVSDRYRKIYQYNEYGYITSMKVYNKAEDWELDTCESYEQTYAFNDDGQCIERVQYSLLSNGQRDQMQDKGAIEQDGIYTWERYWETTYDGQDCHLSTATAYDPWGNEVIYAEYEYDSSYDDTYLYKYEEKHYDYSRPLPPKNHINYDRFLEAALQYRLEGSEYFTWDEVNDKYKKVFHVSAGSDALKVTREISNDTLIIRKYSLPWGEKFSLEEVDCKWEASDLGKEVYTLNADGTRPLTRYNYIEYAPGISTRSYEYESEVTGTWQWDDKGRLTKYTDQDRCETYTYADDYAPQHSLQETLDGLNGLNLYPEEEFNFFGHIATYRYEDKYGYEEGEAEYDGQGRLTCVHYTEGYRMTDTNGEESEQPECQGTMTFHYRADGHLDYMIDISNEDDGPTYYYKEVYIYDDLGTWTGCEEYEGDSENGPWYKTYYESKSSRLTMRRQQTKRRIGEDMSEGTHYINETDGIWGREGYYRVMYGEIVSGYYLEWLISDATIPSNPKLNYTDPIMPLDHVYDILSNIERYEWRYNWNSEDKMWELKDAPYNARRIYKDGTQVKCDWYNAEKEITDTDIYSFDSAGRLIKEESGDNFYIEYTYLTDDSNYLSTCLTYSGGVSELQRFYYSQHKYVKPTDIEGVEETGNVDNQYYDLQGRKVNHPTHGIYIYQGRKILIK
ncbi:MAG: hypothetical protein MSK32_02215 [Paraprevotella sp.]|nr:hypothetical protein [Paraprevotella sp.]